MTFTRMDESTDEQWQVIVHETMANQPRVAEQVLAMLRSLADITDGFAVDQLIHSLQTATRAEEDGADEEMVVASLCHDIGKAVSVLNHPRIAAEILRPYVRDEIFRVIEAHQDFQGRHYYGHLNMDPEARQQYRGRAVVRLGRAVRRRLGPDQLRPRLPDRAAGALRADGPPGVQLLMASVSDGQHRRLRALQQLVIDLGRSAFEARYPDLALAPVVALICAYEEEDNLGAVLRRCRTRPAAWRSPRWWWWTAATTTPPRWPWTAGRSPSSFPVNLGHGVALRVGYDLCVRRRCPLRGDPRRRRSERPGRDRRPCCSRWSTTRPTSWWPRAASGSTRPDDRYRQAGVVRSSPGS